MTGVLTRFPASSPPTVHPPKSMHRCPIFADGFGALLLAAAMSTNLPLLWSSGVRIVTSGAEFCFQSDNYAEMTKKTSSSFRRVNDEME